MAAMLRNFGVLTANKILQSDQDMLKKGVKCAPQAKFSGGKMISYDPSVQPNTEQWLEASDDERTAAVEEFHEQNDEELDDDALTLHSTIHVILENQLAMGVELLPETIDKLMRQGLSRHEAIHAIGAILAEDMFAIVRGDKPEFSPKQYRRKLEKITAKRWRKGQY